MIQQVTDPDVPGMNGYIAIYKGKRIAVWTNDGIYPAQKEAAAHFKAKKSYEVNINLCVSKDTGQVVHKAVD